MSRSIFGQLEVFFAIADEGSLRGAARRLHVSPPSVSQALKGLEERVGLPLFNRTTRSIELTEAGRKLYSEANPALSALGQAVEGVKDLGKVPAGRVRLTLPKAAYDLFFRKVYGPFRCAYPEIDLEISINDATVNIITDGFDAGIRLGDSVDEGMVARRLTPPVRVALFATQAYIDRCGIPKTPAELAAHRLIQYRFISSNQVMPMVLQEQGRESQVEVGQAAVVNNTDVMLDIARKGCGMGRLLEPHIFRELDSGEFIPILEEHWVERSGLHLYFPQNSQKARRIRALIDFLDEHRIDDWDDVRRSDYAI
ncbi:LysR family transcriptional regulator [Ferrimonas sp. YFM]|uniref:LysR family transcriptional regulator n=1 Tax=Ferrimonas sp. YFM TaxID=3028878 RepID=UPI002572EC40|nr:LysR family transcriptional regulator [Ferrimonas sp. YFM]BDY06037.1 LysR family transcriptional regulator [Ferrimonas sp. YFM]